MISNDDQISSLRVRSLSLDQNLQAEESKTNNFDNIQSAQNQFIHNQSSLLIQGDLAEQPQSQPNYSSSLLNETSQPKNPIEQKVVQEDAQSIESLEELMRLLNIKMGDDKKVYISGKCFELKFDQKQQHNYCHQVSSMDTQITCATGHSTAPNLVQQEIQKGNIPDQTLQVVNSQQFQKFDFNMMMANLQLDDQDDLLMIDDLDNVVQPNNHSTCNNTPSPSKGLSELGPINQKELSRINKDTKVKEYEITPGQAQIIQSKDVKSDQQDRQVVLKRHNTEMPLHLSQFIVSQDHQKVQVYGSIQNSNIAQIQAIECLKLQVNEKTKEILKLKDTLSKISQSLAKIYSSPQLLSKDIDDQELIQILSAGFMSQAKLHLAFLFSSPLIIKYKDEYSNELKSQTMIAIDHEKEFSGVLESLKSTSNYIKYRKIPATLDNLRVSLTENPIALHFSGHGIENNKENFGKDSVFLKDEGNFLVIEDSEGCAQFLSEKKLHELLEASGTKLEFVFVASCYSQFAGEIFHNAGAKHVICVRKGFQISDAASILFSKAFYHALFSQTVTVCQAFEIAKAALHAEKDKALAEEAKKFVLLKDSDENDRQIPYSGHGILMPFVPTFKCKKHKCTVFGPFLKGQVQNACQEPMFRLETSKVEDFLGRRKEMQEIISEIYYNRLVTLKGMPGIGKTTLAKAIVYYLDERQTYKEGIILLSLRGLDQAMMILTRLRLLISKHIPNQEEKKDDKNLENFAHVQEKINTFFKDKEILLVLDNAEDTLKKDGNNFREIIQNLLVNCPKLKMLLTSRYPIGHFADISEKIFSLKELTSNFAIELLFKKAMRPIKDQEIQEFLQSAEPARVLHYNPLRPKKDLKRLDEHHMFILLGGHPHAISLAAPLLQDKSLKELYALLNSNEIMDWLRIEGIEGTPLASLKVSLDISIQHMSIQEPQAIKLFCMIGLLPGGCTDEDLNQLWGNGWMSLSEKLLRASLLVKKNGPNNENIYSLFPFMNQYAESLLNDEDRIQEHRRICLFLSKICQELFKCSNDMKINKLVQFETNIWACIYRMIDKQLTASTYEKNSVSRAKSPGLPQNFNTQSQMTEGIAMSGFTNGHDDSSCSDPPDDYYDQVLASRLEEGKRSKSEKGKIMRGFNKRDERDLQELVSKAKNNNSCDEEEIKTQESQEMQDDQTFEEEEEKIQLEPKGRKGSYNQPQHLLQSHDQELMRKKMEIGISEQIDQRIYQSEQDIYPTQQIAHLLSDDQISFQHNTSALKGLLKNRKQEEYKRTKTEDNSKSNEDSNSFKKNTSRNLESQQSPEDSINFNRNNSSSNDNSTPCNQQNDHNSLTSSQRRAYQEISYQRLQTLPNSTNSMTMHQFEDDNQSAIQYNNDYLETSSIDSLQNQLINTNNNPNLTYSQDSFFTNPKGAQEKIRRKSVYSNHLQKVDEIIEESSIIADDENITGSNNECENENILEGMQEEFDQEPCLGKKLSSKKYQEDEKFEHNQKSQKQLAIPSLLNYQQQEQNNQEFNDNLSGMESENKNNQLETKTKTKKNLKRVTIQENQPQQTSQDNSKKEKQVQRIIQYIPPTVTNYQESVTMLTPDGSLLVHYITNLVLIQKFEEALKAIEQFGLKISDQLCIANLKKMQGYILHETSNNHKESQGKYEEALKIFQQLKIYQGQAVCNAAIGFLLYSQPSAFITKKVNDHKIFLISMKRFEEGASLYQKVNHNVGESFCHKMLQFIKQKLGENYIDHQRKYKTLMQKETKLQQIGKPSFVQIIAGNTEGSLFLEVIQQNADQIQAATKDQQLSLRNHNNNSSQMIALQTSQQNQVQRKTTMMALKPENCNNRQQQQQPEEIKQSSNIQNVKKATANSIGKGFLNKNQFTNELDIQNQESISGQNRKSEIEQSKETNSSIKASRSKIPRYQEEKKTDFDKKKPPQIEKKSLSKAKQTKEQENAMKMEENMQSIQSSMQELQLQVQQDNMASSDNELNPALLSQRSKKKIGFKEMGQRQIQKYNDQRKEKLAKKPQNSSYFVGGTPNLEQSQLAGTNNGGSSSRRNTVGKKKQENESATAKNEIMKSGYIGNNEDMIFEKASDAESNSSSQEQQFTNRESQISESVSSLKPSIKKDRPSTSMGISSGKDSSFKGKRTTETKVKFATFNTKKQSVEKLAQDMISPNRTSPSNQLKRMLQNSSTTSSIQPQTQTVAMLKDGFMNLQITTTVTIEGLPQIKMEHKPEILIESLEEDDIKNE